MDHMLPLSFLARRDPGRVMYDMLAVVPEGALK